MSPPVKTNIDFRLAIYETKLYRLLTNLEIRGVPTICYAHPRPYKIFNRSVSITSKFYSPKFLLHFM